MYLIADPVPEGEVDYYEVTIDGNTVRSDAEIAAGQARLHYELPDSLSTGSHDVEVVPVNAWGVGPMTPFSFTKALPGAVSGIGLSAA
jgi:hypothetical protein